MLRVGFEPTIPVFEPSKTFHGLDIAAAVIGNYTYLVPSKLLHAVVLEFMTKYVLISYYN
jgi:hypothetical protein